MCRRFSAEYPPYYQSDDRKQQQNNSEDAHYAMETGTDLPERFAYCLKPGISVFGQKCGQDRPQRQSQKEHYVKYYNIFHAI
jgi:hypothetical protein